MKSTTARRFERRVRAAGGASSIVQRVQLRKNETESEYEMCLFLNSYS